MSEQQIFHPDTQKDIDQVVMRIESLEKIKSSPIVIAFDGRSGTGKSTIAELVAAQANGVYIHTDDFWSGGKNDVWDGRSPAEKVALAIDWKRLRNEVLEPLIKGHRATYQPYDFVKDSGLSDTIITIEPSKVIILDGAYSSRPELADIIDLKVLVEVKDDSNRRTRLVNREGGTYMADWHLRWDDAEEYYFSKIRPRTTFDMFIVNH